MRPFVRKLRALGRVGGLALWSVSFAVLGCHEDEIGYTEVKRIHEPLTEGDYADFVAVLAKVGEQERHHLPRPFLPPPRWQDDRTLPVRELVDEEKLAASAAWEPEEAAAVLPATPVWDRALESRKLTRAQFASLALSFAASLGRLQADPRLPLPQLAARGAAETAPLAREERTFASLAPEDRYAVLSRAVWLTISGRATRLATVPKENVNFVAERQKRLRELLPPAYFADPFDGLYPRPQDYGIPFDEGGVSDATLTWSAEGAILGKDPPDGVAGAPESSARH